MIRIKFYLITIPERINRLQYFKKRFKDFDKHFEILIDMNKYGVWYNYRRAMLGNNMGYSHIVIMEDDAIPCSDFIETVYKLVEAQSNAIIGLHSTNTVINKALKSGKNWVKSNGCGGVCKIIPTNKAVAIAKFNDAYVNKDFENGDYRIKMYNNTFNEPFYFTAPCLVQHAKTKSTRGVGVWGQTKYFIGEFKSGLYIDWKETSDSPLEYNEDMYCAGLKRGTWVWERLKSLGYVDEEKNESYMRIKNQW